VTLSWDTDVDLDLYLLPEQAEDAGEAAEQSAGPGFLYDDVNDCLRGPDDTERSVVVEVRGQSARWVGVEFFAACRRDPPGTEGDGPQEVELTVVVEFPDKGTEEFTETFAAGEFVSFGPFEF
jgi:hypothetical protein